PLSRRFAHQNTETSFDATSSRAISNWQFRPTPGDIFAHNTYRSQFEVKNRYNLAATYDFGTGPFTHSVGFFWNAQEGHPFSLLMGGDPNTDGFSTNDMLNLLNLMDREYGLARSVVNQTYTPVTYLGIVNGSPVYRENTANVSLNVNNQLSTANIRSRWQGKLGLRVTF